MKHKVLGGMLCLTLVAPAVPLVNAQTTVPAAKNSPAAIRTSARMRAVSEDQQPSSVRPTTQQRRSYEREVQPRRHRGISKKEWVFMGAIAGTSMGIGVIAAGGTGVAIGAIVGGWGAYVGHRCWRWVDK